jgi:Icc-related predicted phosphoesterase
MTSFQYCSDLHLEMYASHPHKINSIKINASAKYLIIAGDLCQSKNKKVLLRMFFGRLSPMFEYIFIVMGNHDYYRTHQTRGNNWTDWTDWSDWNGRVGIPERIPESRIWMSTVEEDMRSLLTEFSNVILLQNELFVIPNTHVGVYGTTLWSEISSEDMSYVTTIMSDYYHIPQFTPQVSIELFHDNLDQMKRMLNASTTPEKIVIVTHHLPTFKLLEETPFDTHIKSAYATEVALLSHPKIVAWIAGHTHRSSSHVGNVYVNPIGRPNERLGNTFEMILSI